MNYAIFMNNQTEGFRTGRTGGTAGKENEKSPNKKRKKHLNVHIQMEKGRKKQLTSAWKKCTITGKKNTGSFRLRRGREENGVSGRPEVFFAKTESPEREGGCG